jgi:transposase
MLMIGCDFHPRFQQIAMVDSTRGEVRERRLAHETGEAKAFYAALPRPARVGMEATGHAQGFARMLAAQGHELWVGNPALIRAALVRKQKTDSRDALPIFPLLREGRFPRIWIPSPPEREVRQLGRPRQKLVCFRTSVKNQLHALARGQGSRRRQERLEMRDRLNPAIEELEPAVEEEAASRAGAALLMRQPGVGPVTALAFVRRLGPVTRFENSKQGVSYLGLHPPEDSSGGRQRLGSIRKQGNRMMRGWLREAAQTAWPSDSELRRHDQRLKFRRGSGVAKVALARKLAVRRHGRRREAVAPLPGPRSETR